jgi:hypothetical protein
VPYFVEGHEPAACMSWASDPDKVVGKIERIGGRVATVSRRSVMIVLRTLAG